MNAFTGSKPNYKQNCTYLCRLETHIASDLFGCNSGGLLKIGEKRERWKAPPARRRVRVLSFWRNFLVVVVLLTLGLLRFVVHSFWRFRWERGFICWVCAGFIIDLIIINTEQCWIDVVIMRFMFRLLFIRMFFSDRSDFDIDFTV